MREDNRYRVDENCQDYLKAKLVSIEPLNKEIREFTLKFDSDINPKPGQFLIVGFSVDGHFVYRAYSIARIFSQKEVSIIVKLVKGGALTPSLFSLTIGDEIICYGPREGEMMLLDSDNYVFFAFGVGITPFISLVEKAISNDKFVTLYYVARDYSELLYHDLFEELSMEFSNFDYVYFLTGNGNSGRSDINDVIKTECIDNECKTYLCGRKDSVCDMVKTLEDRGINYLFYESF